MAKNKKALGRRSPLDKEYFMEGNRQKWCAIFSGIGILILGLYALNDIRDPQPFLAFFTGIGVTFILGSSADSVMKVYRVNSTEQSVSATVDQTSTQTLNYPVDPKDVDDNSIS